MKYFQMKKAINLYKIYMKTRVLYSKPCTKLLVENGGF